MLSTNAVANPDNANIESSPFRTLLQEFFRLVNLGRKVWASASIGVIADHELAVLLANHLFG